MRSTFVLVVLVTVSFSMASAQVPPAKAIQAVPATAIPSPVPAPRSAASPTLLPPAARRAMESIDPQRIRAHVRFLSSDLLEGRGTGQRGGDLAAEYLATQFALAGLKPAGDNGGYLQAVPMVGIATDPATAVSFTPEHGQTLPLKLGDDIVAADESQATSSEVEAPLVFAGYGIDAPEYQWDDFKDVDVKGKILLVLVNEPPSDDPAFFKGKALTYYGRWTYKFEEAARKGAVGALIIHRTDMASYGWDVVQSSWGGERSYLRSESTPKLKLAGWMQFEIARQLLIASNQDIGALMEQAKSRNFRPVPLPVTIKAHMVSAVRPFDSKNVVAVLRGSDATLKRQAVMLTAHYDHLGIHPGQSGDNIYNGAIDNATGCATLLEMARAFASAPQPPSRSLIFAAVTGEEQGLRGSEFLGEHPPIPAANIVLGLNFDGLAPYGIPEEIEVVGSERTTFYPTVQSTAKQFNFAIVPDSDPGAGFYYRSDHFSLARVGIPAFSVNEGLKFKGQSREWGVRQESEYNEKHYHQPSDEFDPAWDFRGIAHLADFGFDLAWKAATTRQPIEWLKGDEFEVARKASEKAKSVQAADGR